VKDVTVGNQQARLELKLAWLAGFLDADGSFTLQKSWKNKKEQDSFVPRVSFHNTSPLTIKEICKVLFDIQVGKYIVTRNRKKVNHASLKTVEVFGLKRVGKLLPLVIPYLVTKKLEAQLLLAFIHKRMQKHHNAPYTEFEYKVRDALKELKSSRSLRDCTPSIKEFVKGLFGEDTVRTNAKALEAAEMTVRPLEELDRQWNLDFRFVKEWLRNKKSTYRTAKQLGIAVQTAYDRLHRGLNAIPVMA